jgi:hypothetical protein
MSLNQTNRKDGNNKEELPLQSISYKISPITFGYQSLPKNTRFLHQDYCNITARFLLQKAVMEKSLQSS